jgi:hypothetical protein
MCLPPHHTHVTHPPHLYREREREREREGREREKKRKEIDV